MSESQKTNHQTRPTEREFPLGIRSVSGACACGKTAAERCPDCDGHHHADDAAASDNPATSTQDSKAQANDKKRCMASPMPHMAMSHGTWVIDDTCCHRAAQGQDTSETASQPPQRISQGSLVDFDGTCIRAD